MVVATTEMILLKTTVLIIKMVNGISARMQIFVTMRGEYQVPDPECTAKGLPCPENYIRYGDYCAKYRADCDANPTNVYCDGSRRSDGFTICDKPDHPGYKFCN